VSIEFRAKRPAVHRAYFCNALLAVDIPSAHSARFAELSSSLNEVLFVLEQRVRM
jgi:hypothetical protein